QIAQEHDKAEEDCQGCQPAKQDDNDIWKHRIFLLVCMSIVWYDRDDRECVSRICMEHYALAPTLTESMGESLLQPPHSLGIPFPNVVPQYAEQDDIQFVAASRNGDQDAFAMLV